MIPGVDTVIPAPPSAHTLVVLGLIAVALALFALERIRLESAALLVLISLLLVFTIVPFAPDDAGRFDPTRLFDAFGSEALVAVCALMILGKGIETTQALQPIVRAASRNWGRYPRSMLLALLLVAAILSAFLNNTPIVVVLLAPLVSIAQQNGVSPAKLLLPFGLVTIIGGMATTIGTSTNLLVVTLSEDIAGIAFGMFDFTWYVVIAGTVGLVYLWLLAPRMTPARERKQSEPRRDFMATLNVEPGGRLDGVSVSQLTAVSDDSLSVLQVNEDGAEPAPNRVLAAGDRLFVRGDPAALKETERAFRTSLTEVDNVGLQATDEKTKLIELLVAPQSDLAGKTLREASADRPLGVNVIALSRIGLERQRFDRALADIELASGDVLLCEATQEQLDRVDSEAGLMPLYDPQELPRTGKAGYAVLITAAVVITAAATPVPISIAAVAGVGLMLAAGCMGWHHLTEALNRKVVLVIVMSLALGNALMATSGDAWLATVFNASTADLDPTVIVTLLLFGAALMTNVVTNNAAAAIAVPIALEIARQSGLEPRALLLAVLFGSNLSFITPIGYQTNLLVFSAGSLKFTDFARVGAPLTLLMGSLLSALICWQYGLFE